MLFSARVLWGWKEIGSVCCHKQVTSLLSMVWPGISDNCASAINFISNYSMARYEC
jgi:hypothetical protein